MKNFFFGLLLSSVIFLGFYLYLQPSPKAVPLVDEPGTTEPMATETSGVSDTDLIKQALADKYQKDISEVELTVSENTGTHAKGLVKFAGDMSGGLWFAANTDSGWVIAFDGNGIVECNSVSAYNFPSSMIPQCVDADGNLTDL